MADISDAMDALASLIENTVYPNGTSQPSISGATVQIMQGWPLPAALEKIAALPNIPATTDPREVIVSIYPLSGTGNDPGQPLNESFEFSRNEAGLVITIGDDGTFTFLGTPNAGEVGAIFVNGEPFNYTVVEGDQPSNVAGALFADVLQAFPGAVGTATTIMVPSAFDVSAKVGVTGTIMHKLHRQRQNMQIVVWASNPADRNKVAAALEVTIKALFPIEMPDGTTCVIVYQYLNFSDHEQRQGIYRRDIVVGATIDSTEAYQGTEVTAVRPGLQN